MHAWVSCHLTTLQTERYNNDFQAFQLKDDNSLTPRTRNSKDSAINERGTQLIDFGCEWNLTILIGSVLGDVLGDWTCYRYNGNSVVDYIMISHELTNSVSHLVIQELSEQSDHRPILCCSRTSGSLEEFGKAADKFEDRPLGFKWNSHLNESKWKFITAQQQEGITAKIAELCSTSCNSKKDVYVLSERLDNVF